MFRLSTSLQRASMEKPRKVYILGTGPVSGKLCIYRIYMTTVDSLFVGAGNKASGQSSDQKTLHQLCQPHTPSRQPFPWKKRWKLTLIRCVLQCAYIHMCFLGTVGILLCIQVEKSFL